MQTHLERKIREVANVRAISIRSFDESAYGA